MDRVAKFAGFILAGGRSSRMGRDKAMLEIDGLTMIDRAIDLVRRVGVEPVVVGSVGESSRKPGGRVISDDWPGAGPLGGIATALRDTQASWNLVVACDMPYLTKNWMEFLMCRASTALGDAVVPMNESGAEPLCAIYHQRGETAIRDALENGVRKVTDGLAKLRVEYVERDEWKGFDPDGLLFKNMNEPADYEEAKVQLSGRAKK